MSQPRDEGQRVPGPFEQTYPHIARWVMEHGWVEIGEDDSDYSHSNVKALDPGGMVWEGERYYETVEEALQALEEGIAAFLREELGEE